MGNQFSQGSAKFPRSGRKFGTIICPMVLFDWIIMLMKLKGVILLLNAEICFDGYYGLCK